MYNCLPFLELDAVHDMGSGLPDAQKYIAHQQRCEIALSVFVCPSRRAAVAYPYLLPHSPFNASVSDGDVVAKADYASNGGSVMTFPVTARGGSPAWANEGPPSLAVAERQDWQAGFDYVKEFANGITFFGSTVRISEVVDGTTHTYMVGEKYLMPDKYVEGNGPSDNESLYIGDNEDISRWARYNFFIAEEDDPNMTYFSPPMQDTPGYTGVFQKRSFGSAHAGSWHCVFCDGSVRALSYDLNKEVHRRLCNRKDGLPVRSDAL
jgi:hypothetical protein